MRNFNNRRDALLEVATIKNDTEVVIFVGRMVSTMKAGILSTLDCDMIAEELRTQLSHINRV